MIYVLCFICSFAGGLIDSMVGGGGLILIPALLLLLPGTAVVHIIATNKFAACCGAVMAMWRYARCIPINWSVIGPAACFSFIFAIAGAKAVTLVPPTIIRPLVLVLLGLVAIYTFLKKDLGSIHAPKLSGKRELWTAIAAAALLGFYDGFFGPGVGSFLLFVFVGIFGFEFLAATVAAKALNLSSNVAGTLFFMWDGDVLYQIGLIMGVANMLGAFAGSHLVILKGSRFVRFVFLIVVSASILKLAWETFK